MNSQVEMVSVIECTANVEMVRKGHVILLVILQLLEGRLTVAMFLGASMCNSALLDQARTHTYPILVFVLVNLSKQYFKWLRNSSTHIIPGSYCICQVKGVCVCIK